MSELVLKRTDPGSQSYATLYEHPELGWVRVGYINQRTSLGNLPEGWSWAIRSSLAPVYSPDDTGIPSDQRTWIRRPAISFEGVAPTKDEAIAKWKEHWPQFRDDRTDAEWREIKEAQDYSRKQNLRYDYLKRKGSFSLEVQERIEAEFAAAGPTPDWLLDLIGAGK